MSEIIFEDYVGNVRANSQTAAVLAARLEKAAPEDLSTEERKALRAVTGAAREVQRVQSDRDRLAPGKLRPVLDAFINAWSALYEALSALGRLSGSVTKNGPVAARLVGTLFPDAVSFTKLPADRAWSEGDRRLDRIEQDELGESIETLVGPHFLRGVTESTGALANAIGTGKDSVPVASPTALAEALAQFGRAVGAYGRVLVASVDESSDASVASFATAVAPIDQHRAAMAGRSKNDDEPIDPTVIDPTLTDPTIPSPAPAPSPVTPVSPSPEPVS